MILLLIWLLMRFWDMSVHNKKRQPITTRECDILLRASGFGVDEVNLGFNCNISSSSSKCSDDTGHTGFGRYFKGTNNFLRGLLAKIPLSQIFLDNKNESQKSGLSISQLLAEFGGTLDPDVVRSELAFMGISEDFLNNSDFQWSQDYSFDDQNDSTRGDANLLVMSASYEDMAKHLDAHLAELDIESFRAEDINSILNLKSNMEFKSSAATSCRRLEEVEEDLLFSPTSGAGHYLSTDSLDHQMLDSCEVDEVENHLNESIRVSTNCQANKENYTLAFKDTYSGSSDSQSSKGSCSNGGERKVSWNKLGNSNNDSNQSLDSSGSFVGGWGNVRRSTPTKETFQLSRSPLESDRQNMNLVKMFMKQRTLSTSSTDLPGVSGTTEVRSIEDFTRSTRYRKKSMNDSGKCSTLSQHVLDEEEDDTPHHHLHTRLLPANDDDYQLDSLDVVQSSAPQGPVATASCHRPNHHHHQDGLRDKRRSSAATLERQNSKSIQTSKQFLPDKVIVFPECRLPNLDFIHLEHDALTSQFVSGEQYNQLNGSHPHGFEHIVDWDSLLFLLSREHKEMLKRYPVLSERIRNSYQDSVSDVFDEFPETIDVTFDDTHNVCDCDSLISSTASNNSSNRYSSDSGLGPNNYNFEDLRKLFVYEYNALDEESEAVKEVRPQKPVRKYRERRYTMCSMQLEKPEKRVSFEAGLPKKRTNKSTSSIPRLITSKTAPKCPEKAKEPKVVSKIPKLIKSPSKANIKL